jgi:hypothetical protein
MNSKHDTAPTRRGLIRSDRTSRLVYPSAKVGDQTITSLLAWLLDGDDDTAVDNADNDNMPMATFLSQSDSSLIPVVVVTETKMQKNDLPNSTDGKEKAAYKSKAKKTKKHKLVKSDETGKAESEREEAPGLSVSRKKDLLTNTDSENTGTTGESEWTAELEKELLAYNLSLDLVRFVQVVLFLCVC